MRNAVYIIFVFLLSSFFQKSFSQISQGNYYFEKNDEIIGLSFYNSKQFRFYHKIDTTNILNRATKYCIEKGIGTYKIDSSVLYLTFELYSPNNKEHIKVNKNYPNGEISTYIDTSSNVHYIKSKTTSKYEVISIQAKRFILKKIEKDKISDEELYFVASNKRINDLCDKLNLKIIPISKMMKMGHLGVPDIVKPHYIGEFKDFRKYFYKYFPYRNYYDNRGDFDIYYLIETNGEIKNISITYSQDEEFTMEAIKLIKSTSKKWNSVIKSDKKVNCVVSLRYKAFPQCGGFLKY